MNYHSLLTVSMPLLVLQICITDSLHYYLIHFSSSLMFSRCSFIVPQTNLSWSFHLFTSDYMFLLPHGSQMLQVVYSYLVQLFPRLFLYGLPIWNPLINLFLALDMLALCATARSSAGNPGACGAVPLTSPSQAPLNDIQVQRHS